MTTLTILKRLLAGKYQEGDRFISHKPTEAVADDFVIIRVKRYDNSTMDNLGFEWDRGSWYNGTLPINTYVMSKYNWKKLIKKRPT